MRWIWSGVLMAGLLLILWGVVDTGSSYSSAKGGSPRAYEDGTPIPPQEPRR
jgi:hypothetical protein